MSEITLPFIEEVDQLEPERESNARYVGKLSACLGRYPDATEFPELFELRGIEGYAVRIEEGKPMFRFTIDGYHHASENYTFRVHVDNLRFF